MLERKGYLRFCFSLSCFSIYLPQVLIEEKAGGECLNFGLGEAMWAHILSGYESAKLLRNLNFRLTCLENKE